MSERPATLASTVAAAVQADPQREVWTFRDLSLAPARDEIITRGQLWQRASAFAHALEGLEPGARVVIVEPLGLRLLAAHLGCILAGKVPIIHGHPSIKTAQEIYETHLAHVLRVLAPDAVIAAAQFRATVEAVGSGRCRLIVTDDVPVTSVVEPRGWESVSPGDVALVQHSSGSTGLQKGVALTHEMVIRQCATYARRIALDPARDRICSWIPLYHDMGLFTSWLMPLLQGVAVSAIDPFAWAQDPASFLRLISERRGTLCWQPNFAYNLLALRCRDEEIESLHLESMRGFTNCSEPVRAASHRAFLERFARCGVREDALWTCYAMAENSFAVTAAGQEGVPPRVLACDAEAFARAEVRAAVAGAGVDVVSCGAPVEGCRVRIVDAQRSDLDDDLIGEIAILSPFVMTSYWNNEEATRSSVDAEGCYFTGDLGFRHEGEIYVTGRKKDLLIVAGRNFHPHDIEAACDGCAGAVAGRSVAIGVEDEASGTQRIVVLVESLIAGAGERAALALAVRRSILEELDCPVSEVHVVPHRWLMKTTSGKMARRPNLERFLAERATHEAAGPPRTAPRPAVASSSGVVDALLWGLAAGIALFVILALQSSTSWGVYAGF